MSESDVTFGPSKSAVVKANDNRNNEEATKKRVNVLFLVSTLLFSLGMILCIIAGIMTKYMWCHSRGKETCHDDHFKVRYFAGKETPRKPSRTRREVFFNFDP